MSWSFTAVGRPTAVAAKAREAAKSGMCREPEESFRQTTLEMIAKACESFAEGQAVSVSANGSQYTEGDVAKYNSLQLNLSPLYGFVE